MPELRIAVGSLASLYSAVRGRLGGASRGGRRPRDSAERAAAELAERIRLVGATYDAAPIGFAIVDSRLRCRYVNESLVRSTGCPADDHIGRRLCELLPAPLAGAVEGQVRQVFGDGRVPPRLACTWHVDGQPRHVVATTHPVRGKAGAVVGVVLAVLDMTEQATLQQELTGTVAELTAVIESSPFAIALVDTGLRYQRVNSVYRRLFGGTEELAGADLAAGALPAGLLDGCRAALADEQPTESVTRAVGADGAERQLTLSCYPVRRDDGELIGTAAMIADTTQRHRLAQLELAAAERAAREAFRRAEQARAELEVEHQALQMFQRAMLPAELPRLDGVDVHAVYLPMAERIDIGGDWYDAFLLPDGRLALAVGDVTGHDLRAATVMGQVRNAVRAYATEDPSPGTVLGRANILLARLPDLDLVTMLFGVYDLTRHELVWSNAGHPTPMLRRGKRVCNLDDMGGLLLGVVPEGEAYPEHRLRLAPGDTVLWFTDGIVDHRSEDPVIALERLAAAFSRARGNAGDLLGAVSRDMLSAVEREDDVCLLALRRETRRITAQRRPVVDSPGSATTAAMAE